MYEFHPLSDEVGYFESPAKIGLVILDHPRCALIDAGNDVSAAKKVKKQLDAMGLELDVIYLTHSNADHIGGCAWLQKQTGCRIYAPGMECSFTQSPVLEPSFLYGGFPAKEMRHKFLMAKSSDCLPLSPDVLPAGWKVIDLPGHFLDMCGYEVPGHIVFLADCLSSKEILDKYKIGFIYDVKSYLETLDAVAVLPAKHYVFAHTPLISSSAEAAGLAGYNQKIVHEIADDICALLDQPHSFEDILAALCRQYQLQLNTEQYLLVGSTVRSYLSWLWDFKKIEPFFDDSRMLWKRTESD